MGRAAAYAEYLKSEHWLKFKRGYFSRHPRRCAVCSQTKRVELHHQRYDTLLAERDEDVIALCRLCHGRAHTDPAWREAIKALKDMTLPSADQGKRSSRRAQERMRTKAPKRKSRRKRPAGRTLPQAQSRADPTLTITYADGSKKKTGGSPPRSSVDASHTPAPEPDRRDPDTRASAQPHSISDTHSKSRPDPQEMPDTHADPW